MTTSSVPTPGPLSSGRPPFARTGEAAAHKGRPLVAGIGSFSYPISPRASVADLWSSLDMEASAGQTSLQSVGAPMLDQAAIGRLQAYVNQARQYYEAVSNSDPIAKPLLGYYFILNASKAYLTAIDPGTTSSGMGHGIGQDNSLVNSVPYSFSNETLKVYSSGIFRELAKRTGRGHAWRAGSMQVQRLVPYLSEGADLFFTSHKQSSSLIPIDNISVLQSGLWPNKQAWLLVEVSELVLVEAGLSPRALLRNAKAFSTSFRHVDNRSPGLAAYESIGTVSYSTMPAPLASLRKAFDDSLIVRNRRLSSRRDSITLSPHLELVSSEALTFAVMLHLSNMVRYRPHHVEYLRKSPYWWLFSSWVDRACENFLLSISSRISLREHVIE